MKAFVTVAVFVACFAITAVVVFFAWVFIAEPHGMVTLPTFVEPLVLMMCAALIVALPATRARAVWRRLHRRLEPATGNRVESRTGSS